MLSVLTFTAFLLWEEGGGGLLQRGGLLQNLTGRGLIRAFTEYKNERILNFTSTVFDPFRQRFCPAKKFAVILKLWRFTTFIDIVTLHKLNKVVVFFHRISSLCLFQGISNM